MITEFGALSTDRIRNALSAFGSHALPNTLSALYTYILYQSCRRCSAKIIFTFTSHFQEQFNRFSGICNLHDYSPSFSRWVPQNPGWVDIVRRSNKDSFHRETESTLKLSVLDKMTPKYCSWFLAVIQRLFSPGRHPFLNIIGVAKPDSRFRPTCFSL